MKIDDLVDWTPFSIRWEEPGPVVDWCCLGERRFLDPFFDQTIHQRKGETVPNRTTPAETLIDLQALHPGLPPTGFVFHVTHCGSTLVAQMLASIPRNIVLSEPAILASVLRPMNDGVVIPVPDAKQLQLLRAVLGVLGRPRFPEEKHVYIKFSGAAITKMPLLRRAFPEVPWVFLYREPLEIIASYLCYPVATLPPGVAGAGVIAGDPEELNKMRPAEFWARMLGAWFSDALRFYQPGSALLMNYSQLPEAVWKSLLKFCGVASSAEEIARMRTATTFNAKKPSQEFAGDSDQKRGRASADVRALVDEFVRPQYERLESIRLAEMGEQPQR